MDKKAGYFFNAKNLLTNEQQRKLNNEIKELEDYDRRYGLDYSQKKKT